MQERETEEHQKQLLYKQLQINKTKNIIMGGRTSERANQKYYSLKSKAGAKADETPHFALVEKKGSEYVTTAEFNEMVGRITGASIKIGKTSQGKEIKSFILLLDDGIEISNLQLPFSNLAFSIVNTLASLPDLSGNFVFYVDKQQKDKYWNARCFIQVDEQRVNWKYKYEEYPHPIPIMIPDPNNEGAMMHFALPNGDKQYDKTKMIAFWEKVFIEEVVPKVVKPTAPVTPVSQSDASKQFIDEMNEPVENQMNPEEDPNEPF